MSIVCIAWEWVVNIICIAWEWVVNIVCVVWATIRTIVCAIWTATIGQLIGLPRRLLDIARILLGRAPNAGSWEITNVAAAEGHETLR